MRLKSNNSQRLITTPINFTPKPSSTYQQMISTLCSFAPKQRNRSSITMDYLTFLITVNYLGLEFMVLYSLSELLAVIII